MYGYSGNKEITPMDQLNWAETTMQPLVISHLSQDHGTVLGLGPENQNPTRYTQMVRLTQLISSVSTGDTPRFGVCFSLYYFGREILLACSPDL